MKTSLIILTHKSFRHKGGSVRHSILAALNKSKSIDIIIAENSQCLVEWRLLEEFLVSEGLSGRVQVVDTKNVSRARARNIAVSEAVCERVIFLDDDTFLLDGAVLSMIENLSQDVHFGFGAKRLWTNERGWFENNSQRLLRDFRSEDYREIVKNCGYRKDALRGNDDPLARICLFRTYISNFGFVNKASFDAVGGFAEEFTGYGCEDDSLQLKLMSNFGWPFIMDEFRVSHVDHEVPDMADSSNWEKFLEFGKEFNIADYQVMDMFFGEKRINARIPAG